MWYLWLLPRNVDKKKYNMLFFLRKKKGHTHGKLLYNIARKFA